MRSLIRALSLVGALLTVALLVKAADKDSVLSVLFVLPFALWVVSPYALLVLLSEKVIHRTSGRVLVLLAVVAVLAFGGWIYVQAFFLDEHIDAQVGLLFIFIPLWQMFGALVFCGAAIVVERLSSQGIRSTAANPGNRGRRETE